MRLRGTAQWQLISKGGVRNDIFIQVGGLPGGRWYVDHLGFGARRFGTKNAAWQAIQRLMSYHVGKWDRVNIDRRPWFKLRRSDGSRLLYDTDGTCLYECWGKLAESMWDKYLQAINSGTELRCTTGHEPFNARYAVTEYVAPSESVRRFVLEMSRESGSDYRVIDYPNLDLATERYEQRVRRGANDRYPYKASDVKSVPIGTGPAVPPGIRRLANGTYVAAADLAEYEKLYGPST